MAELRRPGRIRRELPHTAALPRSAGFDGPDFHSMEGGVIGISVPARVGAQFVTRRRPNDRSVLWTGRAVM